MNNIITLSACYITNFATLIATSNSESPWYISLIVSVVSPIFYFGIKFLFDTMITKAKKEGKLTDEQAKDLQDKADDITDDGKLNNSNKEEK